MTILLFCVIFKNRYGKFMQVNKLLVPNKPQFDVIVALFLLAEYGKEKFSGISDAQIIFWTRSDDPTNEEVEQFKKEGILPIDVGGSLFDHHSKDNGYNITATTLIAGYLGIENNPELSALLSYVQEDDLEGLHNKFGDLVHIIKSMYKQDIANNEIIKYTLTTIKYLQTAQNEWHFTVRREFENNCKIIKKKKGKSKIKIGVIESDNLQVANYGITVANMAMIIQKRSSGHVMILTNKFYRLDLRESIAAIRKKELELRGYNKVIEIDKLKFEGKNQLLPNWFYHRSLNAFLNGSNALSETEATKVPFSEIIRFMIYGVTSEKSQLCDCHERGTNCPYRAYGFSKCLDIR